MSGPNLGDHEGLADYLDRTLIQRALVGNLDRLTLGFLAAVSAVREAERHVRPAARHTSGSVTVDMDGGLNVRIDDPDQAKAIARRLRLGRPHAMRSALNRVHHHWSGTVGEHPLTLTTILPEETT